MLFFQYVAVLNNLMSIQKSFLGAGYVRITMITAPAQNAGSSLF